MILICLLQCEYQDLVNNIQVSISLPTVVEGDLKAPFSIATTPRCRKGLYSFPWIAPLILDLYLIILSVMQEDIQIEF